MSLFDPYFQRIRDYGKDLEDRGRRVRVQSVDLSENDGEISVQGSQLLVLREDTAAELGGPQTVGSTFTIWTEDPSLISDGRITLIGPDLAEARGSTLPFGQVALVGGRSLSSSLQTRLEREQYAAQGLPGYSVRTTGGRIWSRVSRQALEEGFSFSVLGGAILHRLRDGLSAVEAAEMVFVTSSLEDVQSLEEIGVQVRKLSHDLRRERIKEAADGSYECENEISCAACPDEEVCSEIRKLVTIRKKGDESTRVTIG
jgi:CO dehydrogenase/acetyl-CoA synthase beta subunit